MIEMISKYDELVDTKNEVENYLNLLNSLKKLPDEHHVKCIVKYILFLKSLSEYDFSNKYYKNCMIYDCLMLMHSLTQNSIRNFYQIYRSFIENFICSMLDLDDNDKTGVRNLFNAMNKKFEHLSYLDEINKYVNGEYSKACDYVHSNIKSNMNVYLYYMDILKNDEMNDIRLKRLIIMTLTLMKKIILFILYKFPSLVDTVFNRRNQELRFLIGISNYGVFKTSLDKYIN